MKSKIVTSAYFLNEKEGIGVALILEPLGLIQVSGYIACGLIEISLTTLCCSSFFEN